MMRALGLIGLLLALAIVALLAKRQLSAARAPLPAPALPAGAASAAPPANAHDPSRQIQQQYRQALDAALQQQQRSLPDDAQ